VFEMRWVYYTPILCFKTGKRFPRECDDLELDFTLPYFASLFRRMAPLHFTTRTLLPTARSTCTRLLALTLPASHLPPGLHERQLWAVEGMRGLIGLLAHSD
jgi:hypothetical protein